MELENIIVQKKNHIAIVTLNHPPVNAWNLGTARDFEKVIDDVEKDENIRVIIITGGGEKSFSAGFDISRGDPLGLMSVSNDGFAYLTGVLQGLADELCQGKLVLALEGGYDLQGLQSGTAAVLRELRDDKGLSSQSRKALANAAPPLIALDHALATARRYWPV